jgi:HEAT repeat protein
MKRILHTLLIGIIAVCGCSHHQKVETGTETAPLLSPVPVSKLKSKALTITQTAFSDSSAYMRNHAIEIAAETQQRQLMPEILGKLDDSSVVVRFAAAIAAGDLACDNCKDRLKKALEDENENVRIGAAYAMIRLGDASGYPKIRTAAVSADPVVRANALLLLGKLQNRDDIALMYQAIGDTETTDRVRMQAVESLARLQDVRIYRSKLWPLLISKYADDRVVGIQGMGALGTTEAREAIQTMLKDDILEVRLCAAGELGKLGDQGGMKQLVSYFQTSPDLNQPTMAASAGVMAIGRMKATELTGYLAKALDSQSIYIRLAAAQSVLLMAK